MINDLGRAGVMTGEINAVQFTTVLIGRQIKAARESAGLSQVDVARKARMPAAMISRLEHGRGNPTVGLLGRIARAIEKLSK